MKTKRHARAACIRTNITKRNITTTTMKRDTITTIMTKVE